MKINSGTHLSIPRFLLHFEKKKKIVWNMDLPSSAEFWLKCQICYLASLRIFWIISIWMKKWKFINKLREESIICWRCRSPYSSQIPNTFDSGCFIWLVAGSSWMWAHVWFTNGMVPIVCVCGTRGQSLLTQVHTFQHYNTKTNDGHTECEETLRNVFTFFNHGIGWTFPAEWILLVT